MAPERPGTFKTSKMKKIITIITCAILLSSCSSTKKWVPGNKAHFEQRAAYKKAKIEKERIKTEESAKAIN